MHSFERHFAKIFGPISIRIERSVDQSEDEIDASHSPPEATDCVTFSLRLLICILSCTTHHLRPSMSASQVEVVPISSMQLPAFDKEKLVKFFMRSLFVIPSQYQGQDPNRLTLLYFTISGLDILGALDKIDNKQRIIDWVYALQVLPPADQPGAITITITVFYCVHWQERPYTLNEGRFARISFLGRTARMQLPSLQHH